MTGPTQTTFSAVADFSTTSNRQTDTWSYLYKHDRVRDGNYQLIEEFESGLRLATAGAPMQAAPGPNAPAWQVGGDTPWVAVNTTGSEQTLQEWGRTIRWSSDCLIVHPGESGMVVVRWLSPLDGSAHIDVTFADAYPSGGGDGIAWYVELDDASQTLASGNIDRGGPATGRLSFPEVEVTAGRHINFVVDSRGDHRCDWTRLDATITTDTA